ncbi:hypothetical protein PsYK624_094590 [Phanerochaete sordida]|uniref:Peptidase A1 domain-containing protein n=1 Tax=Phanerochaete sordida TaxID=48140 RepID=A0A9P3GGJ0_9APHY|nr:hypothetical protein PsYK624_094590 [Phanerochaete sordida]
MPVRASLANPSAPLSNQIFKLTVPVTTGNGQTFENVLLDTGSSFLWVNASTPYVPGPNSVDTGKTFGLGYEEGSATGAMYLDTVTIGSATVTNQYVGVANWTSLPDDLSPLDGFLGLSFNGSNAHLISGIDTPTNTFVDTLVQEGVIDHEIWSMVVPSVNTAVGPQPSEGEIMFGGYDESKVQGDVTWLDVINPYNDYAWDFTMDGMFFGDTLISNDGDLYVDTDSGAIWIGLNIYSYLAIEQAVPGATQVQVGEQYFITFPANTTLADLPPFQCSMGGQNFTLTAEQYIIPPSAYPIMNITDDGRHYSWFATIGFQRDATLGQAWLQFFYSIYDVENKKIGFANYA